MPEQNEPNRSFARCAKVAFFEWDELPDGTLLARVPALIKIEPRGHYWRCTGQRWSKRRGCWVEADIASGRDLADIKDAAQKFWRMIVRGWLCD